MKRKDIQLGKNARAEKRRRKIKIISSLIVVAIFSLVALFVWLINKPQLQIADISIKGSETLNPQSLINIVRNDIEGKKMWFIPKSSVVFYPSGKITQDIYAFDHRIKKVDISVNTSRNLTVEILEHKPSFLWCDNTDVCFYANDDGYVFEETENKNKGLFVVFENGLTEGEPLGQMWREGDLGSIKDFIEFFKNENLVVRRVVYGGEVDYGFYLDNGIEIKIDLDESISTVQNYLDIFISQNFEYFKQGLYEYVDARFGKKIFYKEINKNESETVEN